MEGTEGVLVEDMRGTGWAGLDWLTAAPSKLIRREMVDDGVALFETSLRVDSGNFRSAGDRPLGAPNPLRALSACRD